MLNSRTEAGQTGRFRQLAHLRQTLAFTMNRLVFHSHAFLPACAMRRLNILWRPITRAG